MARTKRKINPLQPAPPPETPKRRIYRTGGYVRLSVEDSGKFGADTIEAQKELVLEYINAQEDMVFTALYCDNGRTGTNFDRPGFEALMEEVRAGNIDCIVVKDLSRFGRNYKETGTYLERIFPFLDVRFVAVNDHFDTLTAEHSQDGYIVPLKNMMNEVYSKDISRKVRSTLEMKRQKGLFTGSWAPYGYQKSSENRGRLEPDPETAPVVRQIFQRRCEGWGYQRIAQELISSGLPSPARYHYLKGETDTERAAKAQWNVAGIKLILSNEVYLGHMVQGVRRSGLLKGGKEERVPEDQWSRVLQTHEALIDEMSFQTVQRLTEEKKRAFHERAGRHDHLGTTPNILRGLIFCADCGRLLTRHKFVTAHGQKRWYVYLCPTHTLDPKACPKKYLHETELLEVLWDTLRREIALAGNLEEKMRQYSRSPKASAQKAAVNREIMLARQTLDRARQLYDSLYPSYIEKLMTEDEYISMKRQYREDMERAQVRLEDLEQQRQAQCRLTAENPWLTACGQFRETTELTEEMAHALLERVEVDAQNHIVIRLCFQDEYQALTQLLDREGVLV